MPWLTLLGYRPLNYCSKAMQRERRTTAQMADSAVKKNTGPSRTHGKDNDVYRKVNAGSPKTAT